MSRKSIFIRLHNFISNIFTSSVNFFQVSRLQRPICFSKIKALPTQIRLSLQIHCCDTFWKINLDNESMTFKATTPWECIHCDGQPSEVRCGLYNLIKEYSMTLIHKSRRHEWSLWVCSSLLSTPYLLTESSKMTSCFIAGRSLKHNELQFL